MVSHSPRPITSYMPHSPQYATKTVSTLVEQFAPLLGLLATKVWSQTAPTVREPMNLEGNPSVQPCPSSPSRGEAAVLGYHPGHSVSPGVDGSLLVELLTDRYC